MRGCSILFRSRNGCRLLRGIEVRPLVMNSAPVTKTNLL
ncbi:hypothetical protein BIW11_06135, partial [Tropilaelaps mercedesae]